MPFWLARNIDLVAHIASSLGAPPKRIGGIVLKWAYYASLCNDSDYNMDPLMKFPKLWEQ